MLLQGHGQAGRRAVAGCAWLRNAIKAGTGPSFLSGHSDDALFLPWIAHQAETYLGLGTTPLLQSQETTVSQDSWSDQ